MNTQTIDCILKSTFPDATIFLGVYPSDLFPYIRPNKPFCFVANTDPSNMPGSHWVAYVRASYTNPIEFFDSYGLPESFYELPLHANVKSFKSLQSPFSRVYGHYCSMYIFASS